MERVAAWAELVKEYGSESGAREAIARREWVNVLPGYFVRPQPNIDEAFAARCEAALRWAPGHLSHRTAAVLHGLDLRSHAVDVTVTLKSSLRSVPGANVFRRKLPDKGCTTQGGLACTTVERTLLDLATVVPFIDVAIAVEAAWRKDRKLIERMSGVLARKVYRGRRGMSFLRTIIDDCSRRKEPMRSALEVRMWWLLREAEFRLPLPGHWVRDEKGWMQIDFAFLDQMLAVEVDGKEVHGPDQFEYDTERQARLAALGWRVPRFTFSAIVFRPEEVLARVAEALGPAEDPHALPFPRTWAEDAPFDGDPFEVPTPVQIHESFELPPAHPWGAVALADPPSARSPQSSSRNQVSGRNS